MRTSIIAVALAAVFASAGPAAAEPAATQHIVVPYSDLNLANEKGRQILDRRIDRAARDVCGLDEAMTGTRIRPKDRMDCYVASKAASRERLAQALRAEARGG